MKKIHFALILVFLSYSGYSQLSLSNTTNGVITVSYGAGGDWSLYDPLSEVVVLHLWIDTGMNSQTTYYTDNWGNTASLITLTWNGSAHVGTIDLNTHSFDGTIIPTGTIVTNFNLILRNPAGDKQSADLLASNFGFSNSTLPVEEFLKDQISLNFIDNSMKIEGLEYNQKFVLDVYDLNGKLVKKINEKSCLNLNELASAVYILKLKTENNIVVSKKVIKK